MNEHNADNFLNNVSYLFFLWYCFSKLTPELPVNLGSRKFCSKIQETISCQVPNAKSLASKPNSKDQLYLCPLLPVSLTLTWKYSS